MTHRSGAYKHVKHSPPVTETDIFIFFITVLLTASVLCCLMVCLRLLFMQFCQDHTEMTDDTVMTNDTESDAFSVPFSEVSNESNNEYNIQPENTSSSSLNIEV